MTGYIAAMRSLVGHKPVLQCGASVIVINENGELLLQKRRDNGLWGYHGGSVELDEVVEEAAARELMRKRGSRRTDLSSSGYFPVRRCIMYIRTATRFQMLIPYFFAEAGAESLYVSRKK